MKIRWQYARSMAVIQVAIAHLGSAIALPGAAITIPNTYRNTFRVCTARLLSVGVAKEAAANACATVLSPRNLSSCVLDIAQKTEIAATDALATCRQVRRPDELAACVVGISRNNQETVANSLDYCRRSLLPVRFAECVVGLQLEVELAATPAMNACIDAGDPLGNVLPTFIPGTQAPQVPASPTPQIQPSPAPTTPSTPERG